MSRLNAPRELPYDFRVVSREGWAWLTDNSERTYLCCLTPSAWAVPLYCLEGESEHNPDPDYFQYPFAAEDSPKVDGDFPADLPYDEAWEEAREEACATHLV